VTAARPAAYPEQMTPLVALAAAAMAHGQVVAGPALVGSRVVWGEQAAGVSVLRAWPDRTPFWQSATSSFLAGGLAGSARLVAFLRSYDPCVGQPGIACPTQTQTLAGRPRGSLHALGPPERCTIPAARRVDVSGPLVARLASHCDPNGLEVELRDARAGFRVVLSRPADCCDVALAGSFLAWLDRGGLDVLDVRTSRVVHRFTVGAATRIVSFDVGADGAVAFVATPASGGEPELVWRSALGRIWRTSYPLGNPPVARVAGKRLIVERVAAGARTELVALGGGGPGRILARFGGPVEQVGGLDASNGRIVWASRRIRSTRTDCPPPGQGRPCVLLKSGVTSIWLADLASGSPRAIVRWAFADEP
jgi:hypothetical protein